MNCDEATLTAALLTPPGRGAVAVIRIHDAAFVEQSRVTAAVDSFFRAVNGKPLTEQSIGRLCYGHWTTAEIQDSSSNHVAEEADAVSHEAGADSVREDVVVCRIDEATVEVSCHGGRAAVDRILSCLQQAGVEVTEWQSQEASITSAFESEMANAVSLARTARTAAILIDQTSGTLKMTLERLLHLDSLDQMAAALDTLVEYSSFGLHLTEPWRVVLAGRPNVGKSTLINALLGYTRAIVFDQPGTTRDVVTGTTALDGWPVQLADTAGIRTTADELERAGIDRTRRTLEEADLVCLLLDMSQPADAEDHRLISEFTSELAESQTPCLVVAHKVDLPIRWTDPLPENVLRVSSTQGDGVEELMAQIVSQLIPFVPPTGTAVPVSQRQVQWLTAARSRLSDGDLAEAIVAIEKCLAGAPYE